MEMAIVMLMARGNGNGRRVWCVSALFTFVVRVVRAAKRKMQLSTELRWKFFSSLEQILDNPQAKVRLNALPISQLIEIPGN